MDREEIIRQFVVKRKIFRMVSGISAFGMIIYALGAQHFFAAEISGPYSRIYTTAILVWVLVNMGLSHYIGSTLSNCPVCHINIPTVKAKNSDRMVSGNGTLPDYCPYCGTVFHKYK